MAARSVVATTGTNDEMSAMNDDMNSDMCVEVIIISTVLKTTFNLVKPKHNNLRIQNNILMMMDLKMLNAMANTIPAAAATALSFARQMANSSDPHA